MKAWLTLLVVAGLLAAVGTGCRTGSDDEREDSLLIEELDGDHVLGARFEDGTRVTDVSFDPVRFAYDSYQVASDQEGLIGRVADYLRRNKDVRLIVEGHCDERGSREYNLSLGEHRALAVRAFLIGLGIEANRIQTRSFGEERPVRMGHTEADWAANRRGEFALYR